MSLKAIVLDLTDNVATATRDLARGEVVEVSSGRVWSVSRPLKSDEREWVELSQLIPFGHKLALRTIAAGEYVLKYGEPIGRATTDIQCGEHVHTHNMCSLAGEDWLPFEQGGDTIMEKKVIMPPGVTPENWGLPISPAIKAGGYIFTSLNAGIDPTINRVVEGGAGPQTRQALANLKATLEAAGSSLEKVVKVTVYLSDMRDYSAMNEAFQEAFPKDPPARAAVQVSALPGQGLLVEIEAIALV